MISKADLLKRIEKLEASVNGIPRLSRTGVWIDGVRLQERIKKLEERKSPTLSVPIVDEHGEYVWRKTSSYRMLGGQDHHDISLAEAFEALEKMCDIEITYQEIKGSKGVVIYEKDQ